MSADRSNDPFSPNAGYIARVDLEHASAFTLSDFRYNRIFLDGSVYRQVRTRGVLAGHARIGWVNALGSSAEALHIGGSSGGDVLHPRKRFYAGGARSVRGIAENQLGPRVLTIPPSKLAAIGCDTSAAAIASCDLSQPSTSGTGKGLEDRDFTPRPLGANTLLEASVELRFPIWRDLGGAVFVDGAVVGRGSLGAAAKGDAAVTPGAGVRYASPVGPIRIDLGFNPSRSERLPVITQVDRNGRREIVQLTDQRLFNPTGSGGGITGILSRFTLHLSIGQAY
jgi:outer membrane protein assembly factor BamA